MIEKFFDWLRGIVEHMAKKNCEMGRHCLHQYKGYKCCCWCRKVYADD